MPNQCPLHQSILLTQGPIHEILVVIAQLLGVVEKLSFFELAILNFFASFPSKLVNIDGIARIFENFDDYPGFQKISDVPILLQHSVSTCVTCFMVHAVA